MRVMIAGGGTGGHVYPGIAIYRALGRRHDAVEVLFVGAKTGVEREIFDDLGLPHVLLSGRGVRGASLFAKLSSPFFFMTGIARGMREILSFKPDVVIGTGGYASVAAVVAAVLCHKTRVLQEQNSVPGMSNRLLSRFAHLVLLSYKESRAFFGGRVPCTVVGNPLRVKPGVDRSAALSFLNLSSELPTVLVFGGSRGAHSINEAARSAIKRVLAKREVQFVFLTGNEDFERVKSDLEEHDRLVRVYPFLEEIQFAYRAANLAVARAGASSVFELAAFGVPAIFVPYPFAADDHQRRNITDLLDLGAAVAMENAAVSGESLEALIVSLLDDGAARERMSAKMKDWALVDADEQAASSIVDLVRESNMLSVNNDLTRCGPGAGWGSSVTASSIPV